MNSDTALRDVGIMEQFLPDVDCIVVRGTRG